ncbi:MAG: histidine kinase N-terminal 7TM domain-containing protein [Lachnospiraceae bacterium]
MRYVRIAVIVSVVTAILLHYGSFTNPYLNTARNILRPFIYIGLYFAWAMSFQKRIVQRTSRYCLIWIAAMMVFWMFVRMCKYEAPCELPAVWRYGWYLYYIPLLLIPTVSLYLALYMRQPESYRLSCWLRWLWAPALLLIGLVLTNDLHQLVFTFPEGKLDEIASYTVGVYGYGPVYYMIMVWDIACACMALLIILFKCRVIKNKKMLCFPFGALGLTVLYGIMYCLNIPIWKMLASDMTAAFCLFIALIIESCIQCGLIPSNTGYVQLFEAADIAVQITDKEGKSVYRSKDSERILPEMVHRAVENPVMLEDGNRLSGEPIQGGYVLWKENLSELLQILKELEDMKEELKDANLLEEENLKTKRQVEKLVVKNQLYDKIQKQTSRQIKLLTQFIHAYSQEEEEQERKKILGKVVVIGAYIKRRSNLIFIAEHKERIPIKELEFCIEETIRSLEWNHVDASFATVVKEIPSDEAMQMYDFFEAVIEKTMEGLSAFTVNVRQKNQRISLCMNVVCETNVTEIARRYGAEAEQDFDGSWLLVFTPGGDGRA